MFEFEFLVLAASSGPWQTSGVEECEPLRKREIKAWYRNCAEQITEATVAPKNEFALTCEVLAITADCGKQQP